MTTKPKWVLAFSCALAILGLLFSVQFKAVSYTHLAQHAPGARHRQHVAKAALKAVGFYLRQQGAGVLRVHPNRRLSLIHI